GSERRRELHLGARRRAAPRLLCAPAPGGRPSPSRAGSAPAAGAPFVAISAGAGQLPARRRWWPGPAGCAAAQTMAGAHRPGETLAMAAIPGMVSVIIVNWNGAGSLPACLAAVRSQRYEPIEIIVVDNGSTDGSLPYL